MTPTTVGAVLTTCRCWEPGPEVVPAARAVLRQFLGGGHGTSRAGAGQAVNGDDLLARLPDAELALSELVTNAVLHGQAPITLHLRRDDTGLRVEVGDGSALGPAVSLLDPTAVTGRGLLLVSATSDTWGVEARGEGKVVWFELSPLGRVDDEADDVEVLLAAWGDDLVADPALEQVRMVLTDLDTELVARSEAHTEALLRELALLVSAGTAPPDQLRTARSVLRATAPMDATRTQLRRQLSLALRARQPLVDLTLTLRRDAVDAVTGFGRALDVADRLSRAGLLLMAPAPVELTDARRSYLRRVLAQLAS